jgi:hypothetical protein
MAAAPCPGRSCRTSNSSGRYENNTSRDSACSRGGAAASFFVFKMLGGALCLPKSSVFSSLFLGFSVSDLFCFVLFCFGTPPPPLIIYRIDSWL